MKRRGLKKRRWRHQRSPRPAILPRLSWLRANIHEIAKQNAAPTRSQADDNLRALFEKANPAELEHYSRFVERAEQISFAQK
jgi:hypothetical protein